MLSRDMNALLQFLCYIFTDIKMSIITEASKLIFEDRFDVRKGQNLKMQLKHAVKRSSNRNRLWLEIVLPTWVQLLSRKS